MSPQEHAANAVFNPFSLLRIETGHESPASKCSGLIFEGVLVRLRARDDGMTHANDIDGKSKAVVVPVGQHCWFHGVSSSG